MQALCKRALDERTAALERLERAVSLAASEGYRRVFLDEGVALTEMLGQVRHVAPAFVSRLLDASPREPETGSPARMLPDPLRKMELEILGLLARGLSNREIADQVSITVGTTKWYLSQIFDKLQVRNRTAAIARARELRLL